MKTLWKSFRAGLENDHGNVKWEIGKWMHQDGEIQTCRNGFHASERAIDAMGYVNCEILALVEVKGKKDEEKDKSAHEYMRIKKAYIWKKEDSVALAIYAAELVIDVYEKEYPNDKRPREAIEAAKVWLNNPSPGAAEAARAVARAAWAAAEAAAWAAAGAAEAAWAAAEAAAGAAEAAWAAAEAAAGAAEAAGAAAEAARAVARAAWAAAEAAGILDKCETFIQERIKTLDIYGAKPKTKSGVRVRK